MLGNGLWDFSTGTVLAFSPSLSSAASETSATWNGFKWKVPKLRRELCVFLNPCVLKLNVYYSCIGIS